MDNAIDKKEFARIQAKLSTTAPHKAAKLVGDLVNGGEQGVNDFIKWYNGDDSATVRRTLPKIGRNQPCPCGSGKKYKRCCGR